MSQGTTTTTVMLDGQAVTDTVTADFDDGYLVGGVRRDWVTLNRSADLSLAPEGDGRTLYGRVLPYNVVAEVADPPHYRQYKESFAPGAFRAQLQAAHRIDVLLNYEHHQGIGGIVGRGVSLEDHNDGLYGSFRMLSHGDGDKALELINEGVLRGLSTEFSVRKSRTVDGVTQRTDARIVAVALCRSRDSSYAGPKAAYPGAEVLSVRTEAPDDGEPPPAPAPEPDSDLMERVAALGVTPILVRAITRRPWDGSPARFTDEEYQRSAIVCRGGDAAPKSDCSLPVLEPNGDLNVNALAAAAGRLGQTQGLSAAQRSAAARKLARYYRQAQMTPPPALMSMAGQ